MKTLFPILMLAATLAWAQDSDDKSTSSTPASSANAKSTSADDRPTNAFGEEVRGHVSMTGDVQFQNQYDDNVFAGTAVKEAGNLGTFSGRLSLNAQTPHSQWQMFYAPTVRIPETGPDNGGGSHQFGLGLQSRLTAATTLSVTGNVNLISSRNVPQQQYLVVAGEALPVFYPGAITPGTRDLNPSGQISLIHQFSGSDSIDIGVNGTANMLDPERNAPVPQLLSDSYSAGGYVGYRHSLTPATSIGFMVEHRYLADSLRPHLSNDMASLTFGHRFGPRWQLSGSIGPSFLIRQGQRTTSYSASASLTRSTATLTYGLSYSDGVQSSAVSNATTFRGVSASVNRTFARRWNAGASFAYSQNSSEFAEGDASSYSGSSSLRFAVTDQLSFVGSYSRVSQLSNGAFSPTLSFDRNMYSFGISYNLKELFRY